MVLSCLALCATSSNFRIISLALTIEAASIRICAVRFDCEDQRDSSARRRSRFGSGARAGVIIVSVLHAVVHDLSLGIAKTANAAAESMI